MMGLAGGLTIISLRSTSFILSFFKKRRLLTRERLMELYSTGPFLVAMVLAKMPLIITETLIMSILMKVFYGLSQSLLCLFGIMLITSCTQEMLVLLLSSICVSADQAITINSALTILLILSNNVVVRSIPIYLAWIPYINVFSYTTAMIQYAEFYSVAEFYPLPVFPGWWKNEADYRGALFDYLKVSLHSDSEFAMYTFFVIMLYLIFAMLSYLALWRSHLPHMRLSRPPLSALNKIINDRIMARAASEEVMGLMDASPSEESTSELLDLS